MADDELLALDRQVCFALAVANRAILGVYRPLLEPLGLTHPQYLVMLSLWGESPQSVKAIGHAIQLDSATLSPLLKRLETAGYITRRRSATDERQLEVALTDTGRALRDDATRIPPTIISQLDMTLDELEQLRTVLWRINNAALAATENGSEL